MTNYLVRETERDTRPPIKTTLLDEIAGRLPGAATKNAAVNWVLGSSWGYSDELVADGIATFTKQPGREVVPAGLLADPWPASASR